MLHAFHQYATRPVEERFWTLEDARNQAKSLFDRTTLSHVRTAGLSDLLVETPLDNFGLVLPTRDESMPANISHFALGQLAQMVGAPAEYLRKLSPGLVISNLREGFERTRPNEVVGTLTSASEDGQTSTVRAFYRSYQPVWNHQFMDAILRATAKYGNTWRVPPSRAIKGAETRLATEKDIIGAQTPLSVRIGDPISPGGVYLDQNGENFFAILVDTVNRIEDGSPEGLFRMAMFSNGELPGRSYSLVQGLFRGICGNHILVGTESVQQVKQIHTGNVYAKLRMLAGEFHRFVQSSGRLAEESIRQAQARVLVLKLDDLPGYLRRRGFSKSQAEGIIQAAQPDLDGSPTTAWGLVNAATRFSQQAKRQVDRTQIDLLAGQLLR